MELQAACPGEEGVPPAATCTPGGGMVSMCALPPPPICAKGEDGLPLQAEALCWLLPGEGQGLGHSCAQGGWAIALGEGLQEGLWQTLGRL